MNIAEKILQVKEKQLPSKSYISTKTIKKNKLHSHANYVEIEDGTFFRVQELKLIKSPSPKYALFPKKKR